MKLFRFKDMSNNAIGVAAKTYSDAKPIADAIANKNTGRKGAFGQAFFQAVNSDFAEAPDEFLEDAANEYMNRD